MLVKRIIETQWRLERLAQVESALYMRQETRTRHNGDVTFTALPIQASEPAEWEQELDALNPGAAVLGNGFEQRNGAFTNLQRYEAHLHRILDRSLHQLRTSQYARAVEAHEFAVGRMKQIQFDNLPQVSRPLQAIANPFDHTAPVVRFRQEVEEKQALLLQRRYANHAEEEPLDSEPQISDEQQLRSVDPSANHELVTQSINEAATPAEMKMDAHESSCDIAAEMQVHADEQSGPLSSVSSRPTTYHRKRRMPKKKAINGAGRPRDAKPTEKARKGR